MWHDIKFWIAQAVVKLGVTVVLVLFIWAATLGSIVWQLFAHRGKHRDNYKNADARARIKQDLEDGN